MPAIQLRIADLPAIASMSRSCWIGKSGSRPAKRKIANDATPSNAAHASDSKGIDASRDEPNMRSSTLPDRIESTLRPAPTAKSPTTAFTTRPTTAPIATMTANAPMSTDSPKPRRALSVTSGPATPRSLTSGAIVSATVRLASAMPRTSTEMRRGPDSAGMCAASFMRRRSVAHSTRHCKHARIA